MPIWLLIPANMFRTVPPSSMVRLLVARAMFEEMLRTVFIAAASWPARRPTATAAEIAPQVPCGCMAGRNLAAMPTLAPTS